MAKWQDSTLTRPKVLVADEIMSWLKNEGLRSLPFETGGILAGFRSENQVVITRASVVQDPRSGSTTYKLTASSATNALAKLKADAPEVVGYVGDWHTHPADAPPSHLDRASMTKVARSSSDIIALLVLTYSDSQFNRVHALLSQSTHAGRPHRRSDVLRTGTVEITDLTSHQLEHLAIQREAHR